MSICSDKIAPWGSFTKLIIPLKCDSLCNMHRLNGDFSILIQSLCRICNEVKQCPIAVE